MCETEGFIGWIALLFGAGARVVVSVMVGNLCTSGFELSIRLVSGEISTWGTASADVHDFIFSMISIAVSLCREHQLKGSRVRNGFNVDVRQDILFVFWNGSI